MNFIELMQSVPLFSEMTNEELRTLEQSMVIEDYPDGHQIVSEEHINDGLTIRRTITLFFNIDTIRPL